MESQEPAGISDAEARVTVSANDQSGSSDSDTGKAHQFNEQTNYVPKRTIITVRDASKVCRRVYTHKVLDLPSVLQRRPARIDGSDNIGRQFVHHW